MKLQITASTNKGSFGPNHKIFAVSDAVIGNCSFKGSVSGMRSSFNWDEAPGRVKCGCAHAVTWCHNWVRN